ncbi:MAG: phage holin, LLH family [Clostridia bacterium]
MNPIYIVLITAGVAAAIITGVYVVIPFAMKKGLKIEESLTATATILNTVDAVLDGVKLFVPGNEVLDVIDKIIEWAQKGSEAAEQMYKASKIEKEERNDAAKKLVYDCLAEAGIERTEQINKIVSGMIEAAVLTLPKTHAQEEKMLSMRQIY